MVKKILIVDDEIINFRLLDNLIDPIHSVLVSTNGEDAIIKAKELSPDLILLDLKLPDVHGFDVCKQLKKPQNS